jgi:hypothetical protein
MDRSILITGLVLVVVGLGPFAWKVFGLGLPVLPEHGRRVWKVQLEIAVRGEGEEGSVVAFLPSRGAGQRIFGENFSSDGLRLSVRDGEEDRAAVWRGRIQSVDRVAYSFNVEVFPGGRSLERLPVGSHFADPPSEYTRPSLAIPSAAPEVAALLEALDLPPADDVGGRVRTIFSFARHELSSGDSTSDDPLLTLTQRAGSVRGRERLFAALLRGAGIPARLAQGLALSEEPEPRIWTEVWMDGRWRPVSAGEGFFGTLPSNVVEIARGDRPLVHGTGTRAIGYEYSAAREALSAEDLAALMLPPSTILRAVSLYRLPVPTQTGLRVLLLFCAGTLVVSLLRNGVGLPSYGTFMPALLALSMRATGILDGLVLVVLVIAMGLAGRFFLERLRLTFVPRLSILVCLVVLSMAALGLVGRNVDRVGLYGGVLLPVVIVTMLVERFAIVVTEEGTREALVRAFGSGVIAVCVYPVLCSDALGHLLFAFPELVVVVIGLQVWMGGYVGYRLTELLRFRPLAPASEIT